jgi:8-oxo-dGTP diphosphatase
MGAQEQGADATQGRWTVIPRTLIFLLSPDGEQVLLLRRAAHRRVFPNRYNGLGGHVERDEDVYTSALREAQEESGLTVQQLRLVGVHQVDADARHSGGIMVFVFVGQANPAAALTDDQHEGTLHWLRWQQLDGLDMVEDLPLILPRLRALSPTTPPYFAHISYDSADQLLLRIADER